jgi:hypothetical protein
MRGSLPAVDGVCRIHHRVNGDEQWRFVSPHYFTVFRIPLLRGLTFSETDAEHSAHVVIN